MAPTVISRDEARGKGLTFFFTGNPCRRGHICERYVKAYTCVECSKLPFRKEYNQSYHKEHRAELKLYHRLWREENRERWNELGKLWAKRNPRKHALIARCRRARIKKAEGSHSFEEIQELFRKQNGKCANCFKPLKQKYEVDHFVPIAKDGSNHIGNLQLLCTPCNRRKSAKDPYFFARENGRLL